MKGKAVGVPLHTGKKMFNASWFPCLHYATANLSWSRPLPLLVEDSFICGPEIIRVRILESHKTEVKSRRKYLSSLLFHWIPNCIHCHLFASDNFDISLVSAATGKIQSHCIFYHMLFQANKKYLCTSISFLKMRPSNYNVCWLF